MSLLSDYEQRTAWKHEPIHGSFHTHEGLSQKVNPDGSYASFPGSTVVFRLENQCLQIIQLMQKVLYHKLGGDMLASILPASSLHMTLHDLISREMCISHTEESYRAKKAESLDSAAAITEEIQKDYAGQTITMAAGFSAACGILSMGKSPVSRHSMPFINGQRTTWTRLAWSTENIRNIHLLSKEEPSFRDKVRHVRKATIKPRRKC